MMLISSSGKDKDVYNAKRRLLKYSTHTILREHRGLSEGSGESQTSSHSQWVLKDEQEFCRKGEHSRKNRSHVQRQRDSKDLGHGCAGLSHVRDGREGLVGREADDVSLTLLSKGMNCFSF